MEPRPLPLLIFGGRDRHGTVLPPAGAGKHVLTGYKGVDIRIDNRPLIELLIERLRTCADFGAISVVGPARVYGSIRGADCIDTDATLGTNLRVAIATIRQRHGPGPIAGIACDVLPEPEDLRNLLADYRARAPCDAWFPLIHAPDRREQLGAGAWKPTYRIVPLPGAAPVSILPGHLLVVDPDSLRLPFLFSLFDTAYRTRNRPIPRRRLAMMARVLGQLMWQDLLHVLGRRWPTLTWTVLTSGLTAAHRLRQGTLLRTDLEAAVTRILVKQRHRQRHPERGIRLPIFEAWSLARDFDTEEEVLEVENRLRSP